MDERQFDALARALGNETPRRRLLQALGLGGLATSLPAFGESTLAGKKQQRRRQRRRRRRNRRKVLICHEGTLISVRRKAVESHLQHGDQLGSCNLLGGAQTCDNPKLPCNTDPTFCAGDCMCFVTSTGGSICAQPSIECLTGGTCVVDQDCVNHYGDGYFCVTTFGCDQPGCTQTGNACTQACQPS